MKKLIFAIAIASAMLFFGTCDLKAQDFGQMPSPEQMAQMQADQMKDVVKLTDAQYPKGSMCPREWMKLLRKSGILAVS